MRSPSKDLPLRLEQRLNAYAMAATAAGVGALCLTPRAEARIVYTPAHEHIKVNGGLFGIDLNHDGVPDFGLSNHRYVVNGVSYRNLSVHELNNTFNELLVAKSSRCGSYYWVPAALPKGKKIGPKGNFGGIVNDGKMAYLGKASATCGRWVGKSNFQAYLGLRFVIKGRMHFGWVRMKVDTAQGPFSAILTGYAYETIPNKPIVAGATKGLDEEARSLGALAAGVAGQ